MKITTYRMPGGDEIYQMAGEADERVPPDAVDVHTSESAVPTVPPAAMPSWAFSLPPVPGI